MLFLEMIIELFEAGYGDTCAIYYQFDALDVLSLHLARLDIAKKLWAAPFLRDHTRLWSVNVARATGELFRI